MKRSALAALAFVLAGSAHAGDIQKWVDEDGRVHYSNRSPDEPSTAPAPPARSGEGWESVIERREGMDEFSERADAVLNGLNVDLRRKRRERDRVRENLEAVQAEMIRHQELRDPASAYALRPKEAEHLKDLQQLENDVARLQANIERVKAIKAMGREQAESQLGQNPFFEYRQ